VKPNATRWPISRGKRIFTFSYGGAKFLIALRQSVARAPLPWEDVDSGGLQTGELDGLHPGSGHTEDITVGWDGL